MHALVEIAGQQFDVKAKDKVKVPLLNGNVGDSVVFSNVLLGGDGKETFIGTPYIEGKVTATILEHGKDKKVLVFKKKKRKGYQKLNGHRQQFTRIAITGVTIDNLGSEEFSIGDIMPVASEKSVIEEIEADEVFASDRNDTELDNEIEESFTQDDEIIDEDNSDSFDDNLDTAEESEEETKKDN